MKQITNADYVEYMSLKEAKRDGRLLTPDTLRFICEACHYDPLKIGQHFLDLLPGVLKKAEDHRFNALTAEEKKQYLFDEQKNTLDMFLEHGAISQEQYEKSLHDLMEKMKLS